MRPARGRKVKARHVGVRVVEIGKSSQVIEAKASDAEVVVVTVAIERLEVLRNVVVGARASQSFVERDGEGSVELWEGRNGGELLAVLVVVFVFGVPEPFVFDEVPSCAPAELLAVEGRFLGCRFGLVRPYVGGETLVAEESEPGTVNGVASAAVDDVDRAARSQVGAGVERRAADLKLLNCLVGDVGRGGTHPLVTYV